MKGVPRLFRRTFAATKNIWQDGVFLRSLFHFLGFPRLLQWTGADSYDRHSQLSPLLFVLRRNQVVFGTVLQEQIVRHAQ